jgi:hypothetical protein
MPADGATSTGCPLVDAVLERHAGALGADYAAYAGHVARVLGFNRARAPGYHAPEVVQVAGAFHDLGIWTARTWDREPSASTCPGRQSAASVRPTPVPAFTGD